MLLQILCSETVCSCFIFSHYFFIFIIAACNNNIVPKTSELLQISSPLYPDTYPVFSKCQWNVSTPKEMIVHMSFQSLNLAKNHCIKISQKSTVVKQFEGKTLPDDLFLYGDALIDFDSSGCDKSLVSNILNSDTGFLLNMTVTGISKFPWDILCK